MNATIYLFQKWAHKVGVGWYGFDLGNAPFEWALKIDQALEKINKIDPNFEIHQVKLKWGRCVIYLAYKKSKQVDIIIENLEKDLFNKDLIY